MYKQEFTLSKGQYAHTTMHSQSITIPKVHENSPITTTNIVETKWWEI